MEAGSRASSAGVMPRLVNPAGAGRLAGARARLPASTLEKMAPKIATPDDPPVEPENVAPQGGDAEF